MHAAVVYFGFGQMPEFPAIRVPFSYPQNGMLYCCKLLMIEMVFSQYPKNYSGKLGNPKCGPEL